MEKEKEKVMEMVLRETWGEWSDVYTLKNPLIIVIDNHNKCAVCLSLLVIVIKFNILKIINL